MPSTDDKTLGIVHGWFNDDNCDWQALQLLLAKGYTEVAGLIRPPVSAYYGPREDYVLIKYLCEEWDYAFEMDPLIP